MKKIIISLLFVTLFVFSVNTATAAETLTEEQQIAIMKSISSFMHDKGLIPDAVEKFLVMDAEEHLYWTRKEYVRYVVGYYIIVAHEEIDNNVLPDKRKTSKFNAYFEATFKKPKGFLSKKYEPIEILVPDVIESGYNIPRHGQVIDELWLKVESSRRNAAKRGLNK